MDEVGGLCVVRSVGMERKTQTGLSIEAASSRRIKPGAGRRATD